MPRSAPQQHRTRFQRLAAQAGWIGSALLLCGLLYWLYLSSMVQSRNWMVNGALGVGALLLVFFLAGMGSALIAGFRSPEGKRSIRSAILITATLGVIVIANVLAYRRHYQWDVTGNRRLSLSPVTVRVLRGLTQKIEATVFYSDSPSRRWEAQDAQKVRDILAQYADQSPNFRYKVVDYMREPDRYSSAQMTTMPPVVLITNESGGREEVKGSGEKDFTGALIKLTRKELRHIYFTTGHGELAPDTADQSGMAEIKTVLTEQQHAIGSIDLMGKERRVPADCTVLVIAGPQVDFQPPERKAVLDYLASGGRVFILLRVAGPPLPWLMKELGIVAQDTIIAQIVEIPGTGLAEVNKTVRISKFDPHDVNRGLRAVYFPLLRSLKSVVPAPKGITTRTILKTDPDTLTKPIQQGQRTIDLKPTAKDAKGPFDIALEVDKQFGEKTAKAVVIGGTDWASDLLTTNPEMDNRYLATNAINWLASEDALVDIPPRDEPPEQITLSPEERVRTFYINLLLVPVVCFFMAAYVLWKRR